MKRYLIPLFLLLFITSCGESEPKRDELLTEVSELPVLDAQSVNRVVNVNPNFNDLNERNVIIQGKIVEISSKDDDAFVIQLSSSFGDNIQCTMKHNQEYYRKDLKVNEMTKIAGKVEIGMNDKLKCFSLTDAVLVP